MLGSCLSYLRAQRRAKSEEPRAKSQERHEMQVPESQVREGKEEEEEEEEE
jgi:hypothetical protein